MSAPRWWRGAAVVGVVALVCAAIIGWRLVGAGGTERAEPGWVFEGVPDEVTGESTEVRIPWAVLDVTFAEPTESAGEVPAPRGGRFVGLEVTLGDDAILPMPRQLTGRVRPPELTLLAGGDEYPLPDLVRPTSGGAVTLGASTAWVAVEDAADLALRVTYDGESQTVTADGEVDAGAFAPLADVSLDTDYGERDCGRVRLPRGIRLPQGADADSSGSCTVSWFARVPYVAGLGWAGSGESWAVATVAAQLPWDVQRGTEELDRSSYDPVWRFRLDGAVADGAVQLSDLANDGPGFQPVQETHMAYFRVPESGDLGALGITLAAAYEADDRPYDVPVRWQVDTADLG